MHAFILLAFAVLQSPVGPQHEGPMTKDHEAIHREMEELIVQIESQHIAIDRMLYQAGSGRAPVTATGGSGIGALLKQALEQGEKDLRDIQRVFELAADHQHKGGGT